MLINIILTKRNGFRGNGFFACNIYVAVVRLCWLTAGVNWLHLVETYMGSDGIRLNQINVQVSL